MGEDLYPIPSENTEAAIDMIDRPRFAPPIGWPLLPLPDNNGQLAYPSLSESVRQSIQVILRTRAGEQLRRPQFGAGLVNFLEEPNTVTTRRRIQDLISQSLTQWEPRIQLERVVVQELADEPASVRIEIAYRLQRTGVVQQLGVTLDLKG
jgi:phage baseplate assembly protein W